MSGDIAELELSPDLLEAAPRRDLTWAGSAAVFGFAAFARLLAVYALKWQPSFDDAWYYRTAVDLASGAGYRDTSGNPSAYFPVGYPATLGLALRLVGPSFRAAQLVNVVLSLSTMACIYGIVRVLGARTRVALIAAAAFGFMPNQVVSCCITMSEITFTFVLSLGVLLALRNWERPTLGALLTGLVFGWATLIRPQAILLPAILIPLVTFIRQPVAASAKVAIVRVALAIAAMTAVVAPWTMRNYRVFHSFVLVSSNGGENLLIGNNPASTQHYTAPATFYPSNQDIWKMPELERDRVGGAIAQAYLRQQPLQAALRTPKKLWYMYRSDLGVTNWIWDASGAPRGLLYYVSQGLTEACYLLVLVLALGFLISRAYTQPSEFDEQVVWSVTTALVVYFSLITMVFFGDARYHQPLMPFLAIAAGYWAEERIGWLKNRLARRPRTPSMA